MFLYSFKIKIKPSSSVYPQNKHHLHCIFSDFSGAGSRSPAQVDLRLSEKRLLSGALIIRIVSVSVFIIAHAPLASALKSCAAHVYSFDKRTAERIRAIDVLPDADADAVADLAKAAVSADSDHDGALILTDVVGATPSNIAVKLLSLSNTAVIAGVNLPMVLTALCHWDDSLEKVTALVKEAGSGSIMQETLQQ